MEIFKLTKSSIITGVTGQDGAYLTQLLLDKGYTVYGTYRRQFSQLLAIGRIRR